MARFGDVAAEEIAAWSRGALDAPLAGDALLVIARPSSRATVLGALQRATAPAMRRGSGGAAASVGPGTLWIALSLARASALVACEPARILNRYVRPLLRALTKVGATAKYFDRDWISVANRPAALVGLAHDAASGRALFEAIVAVSHPFAQGDRASYLGKSPGTLAEIVGAVDLASLEAAVVDAYASAYARSPVDVAPTRAIDRTLAPVDPPWIATASCPIGEIGAGPDARGVLRVGGDFMASRDAVAALESRAAAAPLDEIPAIVDAAFGAPSVALFGLRDLADVVRVVEEARGLRRKVAGH